MNVIMFWHIIDEVHARSDGDLDARTGELRVRLSGLEPNELRQFQEIYEEQLRRTYRWDLWGAAYIMSGGCSDDGYRYFRDWLISEGAITFERALKDPDSLAGLPRVELAELESFGCVAPELLEHHGVGPPVPTRSPEASTPAGEPWEEGQLASLFPRLSAIYGS